MPDRVTRGRVRGRPNPIYILPRAAPPPISEDPLSLAEKLTQEPYRDKVVQDCVALVDSEVKNKGGLSGMAVKGVYAFVKAVKPKFLTEVVDGMLDEWVQKLHPVADAGSQANSGR